jgi:hypothetical protein
VTNWSFPQIANKRESGSKKEKPHTVAMHLFAGHCVLLLVPDFLNSSSQLADLIFQWISLDGYSSKARRSIKKGV